MRENEIESFLTTLCSPDEETHALVCAPIVLVEDDIDTDQIIPAEFLVSATRDSWDKYLFAYERENCRKNGIIHPFDNPRYQNATVLIAGRNFGCGSSREHAAWALKDYGIRLIIAMSVAPIFKMNCYQTGIITAITNDQTLKELAYMLSVNSSPLVMLTKRNGVLSVEFDDFRVKIDSWICPKQTKNLDMSSPYGVVKMMKMRLPYFNWV